MPWSLHSEVLPDSLLQLFYLSRRSILKQEMIQTPEGDGCGDLVAKLCPTLCDPMDCSPSGSSVHRIFQARMLEWVSVSISRGPFRPRY